MCDCGEDYKCEIEQGKAVNDKQRKEKIKKEKTLAIEGKIKTHGEWEKHFY